MRVDSMKSLVLAAIVALPLTAAAEKERARTDGPEGSEIGKGGYKDPAGGNFSLSVSAGGSFGNYPDKRVFDPGPPLFVGLVATYWAGDWYLFDLEGDYMLNNKAVNAFIGPRFRTMAWP